MPLICRALALIVVAFAADLSFAQLAPPPTPAAPPSPAWTDWLGPEGSPRVRARIRDDAQVPSSHSVALEVEVQNVFLSQPVAGATDPVQRGLLRYRLDQNPSALTTDTRLSFDQVPSGNHRVTVAVIGANDRPLTPDAILQVKVP